MTDTVVDSYEIQVEDVGSIDWDAGLAFIEGIVADQDRELADGSPVNAMTMAVSSWREEADFASLPSRQAETDQLVARLPDPHVVAGALTADQLDAAKGLLSDDLARLRAVLAKESSEDIEDGFECLGRLEVEGLARTLRMERRSTMSQYPADGLYLGLERLGYAGVLWQGLGLKAG